VSTRVAGSKVMKAASSTPVALSTIETTEVLSQAEPPVQDLIAGSAYSEAAFTEALVRV